MPDPCVGSAPLLCWDGRSRRPASLPLPASGSRGLPLRNGHLSTQVDLEPTRAVPASSEAGGSVRSAR